MSELIESLYYYMQSKYLACRHNHGVKVETWCPKIYVQCTCTRILLGMELQVHDNVHVQVHV